jgi:hypothetical protein
MTRSRFLVRVFIGSIIVFAVLWAFTRFVPTPFGKYIYLAVTSVLLQLEKAGVSHLSAGSDYDWVLLTTRGSIVFGIIYWFFCFVVTLIAAVFVRRRKSIA